MVTLWGIQLITLIVYNNYHIMLHITIVQKLHWKENLKTVVYDKFYQLY